MIEGIPSESKIPAFAVSDVASNGSHFFVASPESTMGYISEKLRSMHKDDSMRVKSMHLEPGRRIDAFMEDVYSAAHQGAQIYFDIDGYAQRVNQELILPFGFAYCRELRELSEAQGQFYSEIRGHNNCTLEITNPVPSYMPIPYLHRNHMKWFIFSIAGKETVGFTGLNLSDFVLEADDISFFTDDPSVVAGFKSCLEVAQIEPRRNIEIDTGENSTVVRASPYDRDVLRNTALTQIRHAKASIDIASQYMYDPQFIYELKQAVKRGVNVRALIRTEDNRNGLDLTHPINKAIQSALLIPGIDWYHHPDINTHLKLLNIDDSFSLIGSWNVGTFVLKLLGTEENALCVYDPNIIRVFKLYFEHILSISKRLRNNRVIEQ